METKKVPDTPWHIGFIKKDESDPRRHKARCFYYQDGECQCVRSSYYTLKCPGSSHCSRYREDEETVQVIRNIQEERKRAEKYHELKIKMRIDLQNMEIPVKEGRRSAPTVRLVRSYRCEAPPSIVKSIVACSHVYKACTMNNIEQKERDQGGVRGCA